MPVRNLLRLGSNTISIRIQPAITEAAALADKSPYVVPAQQVNWTPQTSPYSLSHCLVLPCVIQLRIQSTDKAKHAASLKSMLQGPGMAANLNRLRKPGSDFGWDWGPCFAPSGTFGALQLRAYSHPHVTGAHLLLSMLFETDLKIAPYCPTAARSHMDH